MRSQELSKNSSSSSIVQVHRKEAGPTVIDGQGAIRSVVLLVDGHHVVSGGDEGKIRRWRIEDGKEVGAPMDAGSPVFNIAVSRDGKVIVGGTKSGLVTVWNAESHSKVSEFQAHPRCVPAVDVSPDATRIATGSDDHSACVWSLSTRKRLLRPLKHNYELAAVKFSPNGHLIATATWNRDSVRVYNSQNGSLLVEFPVQVYSALNRSLSWATDSKELFVSSRDRHIHRVDVSTGTTLSQWYIPGRHDSTCITLASNGTLIAASVGPSVSFWDTTTQEQIGSVVEYTHDIWSMAMSSNYELVTSGRSEIILRALCAYVVRYPDP